MDSEFFYLIASIISFCFLCMQRSCTASLNTEIRNFWVLWHCQNACSTLFGVDSKLWKKFISTAFRLCCYPEIQALTIRFAFLLTLCPLVTVVQIYPCLGEQSPECTPHILHPAATSGHLDAMPHAHLTTRRLSTYTTELFCTLPHNSFASATWRFLPFFLSCPAQH